jgi:hypothetical protein
MKAYRLKITLQHAGSPVWRRIDVPAGSKFGRLKVVIAEAMEYYDRFRYVFRFEPAKLLILHTDRMGRAFEGMRSPDGEYEKVDVWNFVIDDVLQKDLTFYFDCDFDDVWVFEIKTEQLLTDYPHDYPRVIEYAGLSPLADIAADDADDEPSDSEMARTGSRIEPEYDAAKVNERLMSMSSGGRRALAARSRSADDGEGAIRERKATPTGPDSFLPIADRIHTMSDDELKAAFKTPETLFGYLIFDRKPVFDLRSLFQSFKRKELQDLAYEIQLPRRSGLNKAELVDAIYDCYKRSTLLHLLMNQSNEREVKVLGDIMNADVYYVEDEDFPYGFALTLLYHHIIAAYYDGDRIAIVAFQEFKEKYIEAFDEMRELLDDILEELDEYARAAANLYGILSMGDFMRIYLDQTDSDLEEAMARRMLSDLIGEEADSEAEYRLRGDFLISDSLGDWDIKELEDLFEKSRKYPLHVPPREEFLRYADWFYFEETPAHDEFAEYILKRAGRGAADEDDRMSSKLITGEICSVLRQWAQMQECFDILESFGIEFSNLKDTKKATQLIARLIGNTRIWGNNGATRKELLARKQGGASQRSAERKIGRNEPCPCGSGKKYKHCCGKLLH